LTEIYSTAECEIYFWLSLLVLCSKNRTTIYFIKFYNASENSETRGSDYFTTKREKGYTKEVEYTEIYKNSTKRAPS